ncbi:hypothetical protein F3Y22_tig00111069pilonHSYRG00130 [Hibiscus syriacus]|uniref:Uncharacterized protein n=1 Tax=Hibiscus syriacus TaxID=106335 RepID=A0A6A2Z333_HIBSY|nr:hypothetical protein F3Y22_tig00111069pilonHSYRG00130 [Hibiscus syriacus]
MSNLRHFLATAAVFFLVCTHPYDVSGRVLDKGYLDLVLQSAQKGEPIPPSGPNGCTHIPGGNGPPCIGGRAFAGHVSSTSNAAA